MYIYIYIYTSVNPCITCTKQSGAEQKLMPITDEQGAALFERPLRTQETNASHGCELEQFFLAQQVLAGVARHKMHNVKRVRPFWLKAPADGLDHLMLIILA